MKTRLWLFSLIFVTQLVFAEHYTARTLHDLSHQPVLSRVPMETFLQNKGYKIDFYGDVYHVTLKGGTEAVFKALLPDDYGDIHAEVAAFKASQFLGFPNIPPTLIRTLNDQTGSLQLYAKPSIDALKPGVYKKALQQVDKDALANLKLFYFVFGQWDSGPHNLIIQQKDNKIQLIAIDNSGIRNKQHVRYGELPFVRFCYSEKLNTKDFDEPFPFDKVKSIPSRSDKQLRLAFGAKLPKADLKRLKNHTGPLQYVIYRNALWIQFHSNNPDFVLAHTHYYPKQSIAALKKLNLAVLKKIFNGAKEAGFNDDFITEEYLQGILGRRDQILQAAQKES
jgi:hypothetical protein